MKERLDDYLVRMGFAQTKSKAQARILAGETLVNEVVINKKAHPVDPEKDVIRVRAPMPFVSRGGEKLLHALTHFSVIPVGRVCVDIGASTGGFTDCLLKNGAAHVHAVDVGHHQIAYSLRVDERVSVYEKVNARALDSVSFVPEPDLIVSDVSFISVTKIVPSVMQKFPRFKDWIMLIKPQFEAERHEVGKGGIIRDESLRKAIVMRFLSAMRAMGLENEGVTESPITGAKGNIEYLGRFKRA